MVGDESAIRRLRPYAASPRRCLRYVAYRNIRAADRAARARLQRTIPKTRPSAARWRGWLAAELRGRFAALRGRGGPGDENACVEERIAWERQLGAAGWIGLGWPREVGGRGAPLAQQVIFHEEYARAGGPGRIGHIGENLLGPTLIAFGSEAQQKRRFLPPILRGEELWCQGYSEPNAGSDLANVQTRARLEGDEWVIDGQKVWTSWARVGGLVLRAVPHRPERRRSTAGSRTCSCRCASRASRCGPIRADHGHRRVQRGVLRRRAHRGARTSSASRATAGRWRRARSPSSAAPRRSASSCCSRTSSPRSSRSRSATARARDPLLRQRLADAWIGLEIMR